MREIHTRIEIESPVEVVWDVLTDTAAYPAWNPFIPRAEGELRTGSTLRIDIQTPGRKPQPYRVRVTGLEPPRAFSWLGHFHVPGLIDGDHRFELRPLSARRVEVLQWERFGGLLVPFVYGSFLNTHLRAGFEALNRSLKQVAERRAATS